MTKEQAYLMLQRYKYMTEFENPKNDPMYPELQKLCKVNKDKDVLSIYDHRRDTEQTIMGFLPSLIPLLIYLITKWSNSVFHTVVIFALFASAIIIHVFKKNKAIHKDKNNSRIIIVSAVALSAIFITTRFTDFNIMGSEKILVIMYIWFIFVLYLLKLIVDVREANKYNKAAEKQHNTIDGIKSNLNERAKSYEESVKALWSNQRFSERFYWWNYSYYDALLVKSIFTPVHTNDHSYDSLNKNNGDYVSVKKEMKITERLMVVDVDESEKAAAIGLMQIPETVKISFADNDGEESRQSDLKGIIVRKIVETHTTTETEKREAYAPTEQDIARYRSDIDDKFNFDEVMMNGNLLTHEENKQYAWEHGASAETKYEWEMKTIQSEELRRVALERKIEKNTGYNYNKYVESGDDVTEEDTIIGLICGKDFYFIDCQLDKVKEYMNLRAFSLYVKENPKVIDWFKANPFRGYKSEIEAKIGSMIAHSDGIWD